MRLTLHSDYALRLLMTLALEAERRHTIEEIADRYGISTDHLRKVAQTLVQAGLVDSLRGRGGGLMLRRAPEQIRVGEVLRATEDSFELVECFDRERNQCVIAAACGLPRPLQEAMRAFMEVLDRYTLADVIRDPQQRQRMRRMLGSARSD